jgi:hypothetical protein
MALGKNMKIDRLVPLAKKETKNELDQATLEQVVEINSEQVVSDIEINNNTPEVAQETEINQVENNTNGFIYSDIEQETITIRFKPSRRKTQKRILIDIEGAITINNIELMHAQVHQVFENYDFVEVNLKNITEVDLTAIQLFHAIRVSYYPQNKFISINAELASQDRKLLNTCGFTEFQTQVTANV